MDRSDIPLFSKRMANVFLANIEVPHGAAVAGYRAFRGEIDPAPLMKLLHARGACLALPVVTEKGQPLLFRRYRPGDSLRANAMGIAEPDISAPEAEPDILLVPLLAFDRARNRLGYGGGYYDRTLTALRARKNILAVGIAYAFQEAENVPCGPGDAPLDRIVTELNVF
ncbi:MAG: 5-formyltetrahydrofolate cyclo-ligase [Alphaproteobacteria bacterium]|nr:5-formyltetrahydrofolate cyclo-ligase [Alphaproteobacteria bacterium]